MNHALRTIALNLPQFHPTPENDQWWGKGFTEWTNVTKCTSRFPGHYQPHLPADLGFYDLRLPEARLGQAELAKEYGISGFCYYHYWFNGRRILERPVNEILQSGEPDFPFCLCWANHNWTRRWDGQDQQVLLRQSYSEVDDTHHIRSLLPMFADARYIRVDGKPVFLVFLASHLPDAQRTTDTWRSEASKAGFGDLFLGMVQSFTTEHINPATFGFDFGLEFAPDWKQLGARVDVLPPIPWFQRFGKKAVLASKDRVFSYRTCRDRMLAKSAPDYKWYRCATPSWDNSARRASGATILVGSTPELYGEWLSCLANEAIENQREFVFINAWNEWAEGNHLEPCQKWGRAYLEATKRALREAVNR